LKSTTLFETVFRWRLLHAILSLYAPLLELPSLLPTSLHIALFIALHPARHEEIPIFFPIFYDSADCALSA
jgi:hypothetical protein